MRYDAEHKQKTREKVLDAAAEAIRLDGPHKVGVAEIMAAVPARDAAAAGCLATGLRALNAVPAVNDLPPGWVTALDLPLIPGAGTIR